MPSKEQRKLQKKRKREKENRKQTLKRREALRAPAREERAQRRAEKRIDKLQKELDTFQSFSHDAYKNLDESKMEQLEKNVEILRGLEAEWQEELNKKKALNSDLEKDGHMTLDEKLRAVSQATIEKQKAEMGVGGSAECKVGAPPKRKRGSGAGLGTKGGDFAEVSVVKSVLPDDVEENS